MDSKPAEAASRPPLKYQTWFLKVSIHCDGCRRKVKKVLQSIDGVFTTTIDQQQQKVTVTGSVGVETLLRKLVRAGKHAEIWPENLAGKDKTSDKAKKRNTEKLENHSAENKKSESAQNCNKESKSSNSKTGQNSPEKSPSGDRALPEDQKGGQSGGGGSGKKKKKKAQSDGISSRSNGLLSSGSSSAPEHTGFQLQNQGLVVGQAMGQVNLIPTRQQPYLYTETGYPPMLYVAAYNRLYPMGRMGGPSYYVPPSPYMMRAEQDQDIYQFQSRPLVSFEIFSDENANGCSVM